MIILPRYVEIIINHYKDPPLNNQDFMKSIRPSFFVARKETSNALNCQGTLDVQEGYPPDMLTLGRVP